jgi:hypothetical protein
MAAGLGFKTFTTGEVLTAGDTNGYLMQGVLVFADAAARSAAVTSPQEGQVSYLKSDDGIYTYSGSAWISAGLPSQTGNSGKYLTTNGTIPSWGVVSASPTSANSFVATSETTSTGTTLADLTTVQALTVTTGTKVLVLLSAEMSTNTTGGNFIGRYGVAVSGATTRSANANEDGLFGLGTFGNGDKTRYTSSIYLTCTAGSNTFTMKFATGQGGVTSTFSNRRMTIIDLGS